MKYLYILGVLQLLYIMAETARILTVMPTCTKSHYISFNKVILELASRGHEMVVISPYEEHNPPPNWHWIEVEVKNIFDAVPELKKELNEPKTFFGNQKRVWNFSNKYAEHITGLKKLNDFIKNDNSTFDLVIAEEFFQPVFYLFAYKYKTPLILSSSFGYAYFINEYMGNSMPVSYIAHEFSDMFGELNFFERAKNAVLTLLDILGKKYYVMRPQNELAKKVFGYLGDLPDLNDLEREVDLILINSHYSMSLSRPLLPNMIEIGGSHLEQPKPLNSEIKDILDNAENGAILFCFGSVVEISEQPEKLVLSILKALGRIPHRVLLKWTSKKPLPLKYPNVYPMSWIPQNDVLAHPKILAFITHGGLHSYQEAIYNGIPTICIPFFGDQPSNCKKSQYFGHGIMISNEELTEELLHKNILELTSNKSYRDNAKLISKRFNDRQNTPLETATYWIEYVLKHKGANFLKCPKRNMPWYKYFMIDIGLFALLAIWLLKKCLSMILGMIFKKSNVQKVKKN